MKQEMADSTSSGTFSHTNRETLDKGKGQEEKLKESTGVARPSGHQSSKRSTNGSVTNIGLHISPNPKKTATGRYRHVVGRLVYRR
jgi:hypothetical protein